MSLSLADEVALLSLVIERAGTDTEALILARLEFQSLWEKFRRETQPLYDAYTAEAADEFALQLEKDREPGIKLAVLK